MTDVIDPDNDMSVWGVSPSVFRAMVVVHTGVKFRDTFGVLDSAEIDYLTDSLMDGFYSFNFTDALASVGVDKMNERITGLLDTYRTKNLAPYWTKNEGDNK